MIFSLGERLADTSSTKAGIERSVIILACAILVGAASAAGGQSTPDQTQAQDRPAQTESPIVILNDSQLPETYPRATYEQLLRTRGGVPPHHWKSEKGTLPPGLKLEDYGLLHGQPERAGEFKFTLTVTDGSSPPQAVQKEFVLRVRSALSVRWKTPAHVSGNRIDGSVVVSNTTPDDMDLTYVVMAVAGNGRATAIGYQHYTLTRGTIDMELPFGETLPSGGYVVHVDVVGEVGRKNLIYRERMQTPGPLQVTVGP